ncbi:MAG TPA: hypothetical protein VNF29_12150 [Candidatus Binataceae bacterium]|nr:hypothetical protein [Candidatus Binataceae bacterium]
MKRNPSDNSPPTDAQPLTLVIDAGTDHDTRRIAFNLLGNAAKDAIQRLPNGQWTTSIPIPSDSADAGYDEMRVVGRTRRDVEGTIDRIVASLVDPESAMRLYAYFRSLAQRGEHTGCAVSGDLITPEGEIVNIDSKTEAQ